MRFDIRHNGIDYEVMVEISIDELNGGVAIYLEVDDVLNGQEYDLVKDIDGGSFNMYEEIVGMLDELNY